MKINTTAVVVAGAAAVGLYLYWRQQPQTVAEVREQTRAERTRQVASLRDQLMKKIGAEFWDA